jgi:hypothetical protein
MIGLSAMPARDRFHDVVKAALIRDGWTVTHDPLRLRWGVRDLYVDLGAERLLAAEKGATRIAVEVKSFTGPSEVEDLEKALGQYTLYAEVLGRVQPDRHLYLAVSESAFANIFAEPIGNLLIEAGRLRLVVFDPEQEVLSRWVPEQPSGS